MKDRPIIIPSDLYQTRVHGCWLGKSIGGTLGGPWEGRTPPYELTFYDPIPTAMLENDDLDLQLVWLARLRESGFPMTGTLFARAWRDNIQAWPDEYGVCRRNLDQGLLPPLTGSYDNGFTAGMGAAIRTELWACLAPGDPELARYFAREDARCDHADEGVWAAEFLVTVESLAFIERDRERLIEAGLKAIPEDSRVARAIRFTLEHWARTPDRRTVFERLDQVHGNQNFTDVPINLAIIVLGWCAGEGDFGKSLLAAVNCGYDADCTCATLGAILGLLEPGSIAEEWKKPIGDKIAMGGYITGITPPATLQDLTRMTGLLARESLHVYGSHVSLGHAPETSQATPARYPDTTSRQLRAMTVPGNASVLCEYPLHLALCYPPQVRVTPGEKATFRLLATNTSPHSLQMEVSLRAPLGWTLAGEAKTSALLAPGAARSMSFTATAPDASWRPYVSWLGVALGINGVPLEFTAGLLMTIPFRLWSVGSLPEKEPLCPAETRIAESSSHFLDLAPYAAPGRTLVLQTELKDPDSRNAIRRIIVQAPGVNRAWVNGVQVLNHDGSWHVCALHRAGATAADVSISAPTRLTVALDGATLGAFFHAVGEPYGNCNRWISKLEYQLPAAGSHTLQAATASIQGAPS